MIGRNLRASAPNACTDHTAKDGCAVIPPTDGRSTMPENPNSNPPRCQECGMTATEIPAAAWWAEVDLADAICCEVPIFEQRRRVMNGTR